MLCNAVELWQQLEDLGLKRDERHAAFQSNMQGQLDLLVKQRYVPPSFFWLGIWNKPKSRPRNIAATAAQSL